MGLWIGGKILCLESFEDEPVDGVGGIGEGGEFGWRGAVEGLQGPVGEVLFGDERLGDVVWLGACGGSAGGDPTFDELDFFFGNGFAFPRHIAFADEADEFAFSGFAGDDGDRAVRTVGFGEEAPQADVEIAFADAVFAVAVDAAVAKDGTDIFFKNGGVVRAGC